MLQLLLNWIREKRWFQLSIDRNRVNRRQYHQIPAAVDWFKQLGVIVVDNDNLLYCDQSTIEIINSKAYSILSRVLFRFVWRNFKFNYTLKFQCTITNGLINIVIVWMMTSSKQVVAIILYRLKLPISSSMWMTK